MGVRTVWPLLLVVLCSACSTRTDAPAKAPQIPTILAPTTVVKTPVMVDRELPQDCESIVPVEVVDQKLGRQLGGATRGIIGIKEPSLGRTGKIDCYYGLGDRQPLTASPLVIGLSTYTDEATAKGRVTESVDAERREGGSVAEVDVGKVKASVVGTSAERLLIGSLGKTTFVVRMKAGTLPDDQVGAVMAGLAQQSMTPVEDA
ncbi:hypothetical protein [Actinosynnema sp. NPDC020468]|uniref:hypothetical protein n=1 Tax=Actinosynnema sp. NPDC020468 TaxID=3154488 RepID=UPI0034102584